MVEQGRNDDNSIYFIGNCLAHRYTFGQFVDKQISNAYLNLTHNPTDKVGYRVADIFQALSLIGSQIIAVLSAKGIYSLFQSQATAWLAIPFGLLCFLFGPMAGPIDDRLQAKYEGKCPGDLERHVGWSWAVGLGIGWVVGSILLLL